MDTDPNEMAAEILKEIESFVDLHRVGETVFSAEALVLQFVNGRIADLYPEYEVESLYATHDDRTIHVTARLRLKDPEHIKIAFSVDADL